MYPRVLLLVCLFALLLITFTDKEGIEKGYYQITNVIVCDLLRVQSKGAVPYNNLFMDMIYSGVALVGDHSSFRFGVTRFEC